MRAVALPLIVIALLGACETNDLLLPTEAPKRQRTLSQRILEQALINPETDPGAQSDLALALAEVVIIGQAPRLRMVVSGNHPTLAKGAAKALVQIRLLRSAVPRKAILGECVMTETNAYVKDECARASAPPVTSSSLSLREIVSQIESTEVETRRIGLRHLLSSPTLSVSSDHALESGLYHGLQDTDGRVRVLTSAVFLRRSIAKDPFATDSTE